MYIERNQTAKLRRLADHFPVVVVTGARQVGKSTLLQHLFSDRYQTIVFDPVVDVGGARSDPELFLDNHPAPLILDEIQYAPELLPVLKRKVDRKRVPGQYILTGSQQWGVLKSVAESLAGRAVFLDLHGFSANEADNRPLGPNWLARWLDSPADFPFRRVRRPVHPRTLYEQLWRGWLPEAQFLPLDTVPDFLAAYRRTYIERDVRLLADVGDLQLFGRFFGLAAALTAQEINHSQLGRELGVTPQTARRWLNILSDTYQWFEVPGLTRNAVKRVTARAKGYLGDTGLACVAQMISSPTALGGHALAGALFETAVIGELRKLAATMASPPAFHHWRTRGGAEVDIVLERDGTLFPIEVKLASTPSRRDTSGLRAFRESHCGVRVAPGLVLAPTEAWGQLTEHEHALPWDLVLEE